MAGIERLKKGLRYVWISVLLISVVMYFIYGQHLTAEAIKEWITAHTHALIIVYCLLCIVRAVVVMPSTPFIFAGILLFPGSPVFLFIVSLSCILLSSLLIYYGSSFMGFGPHFEKAHEKKITAIRNRLSKPSGFYFIAGWSLLPFTPTDLITYVAGTIKLPLHRLLIPLMLGEAVIVAVYVFNGVRMMEYFSLN
jgi:uncharacterized membrane protein YdjX (TVP38/TMEM64 family)